MEIIKLKLITIFLLLFSFGTVIFCQDFKSDVLLIKKSGLSLEKDIMSMLNRQSDHETKGIIVSNIIIQLSKIKLKKSRYVNAEFVDLIEEFMDSYLDEINYVIPLDERKLLKSKYNKFITLAKKKVSMSEIEDRGEFIGSLLNKANVYFNEGKNFESIKCYTQIIDVDPKNYDALLSRAIVYEKTDKFSQAVNDYQKLIRIYPKSGEPYLRLSGIYIKMNLFNEALNYLKTAVSEFPDDRDILLSIAKTYIGIKKYSDAMLIYRKVLQKFPYSYEALMGLGNTYTFMKEYESAISYFTRANEVSPEDETALFYLSVIYRELKDNKKAISYLDRIIAKNPHNIHVLFTKGTIYYEMTDFESAKNIFRNILRIKENHLYAALYLGSIAKYENDLSKSKYYFELASKMNPNSPLPSIYLGNLYIYQQKYSLAMTYFIHAKKLEPSNIEVLVGLAQVYFGENNPKKALPFLKQVLYVKPDYFPAINLIAEVYDKLGELKQAVKYYLLRNDSFGWERIATIYEKKGMYRKAIYYYKKLLSDKKKSKIWVNEKIKILKRMLRLGINFYYANELPIKEIETENIGNRKYGGSFNINVNDKLNLEPTYGHSFMKEKDLFPLSDDNFGLKWKYKFDLNSVFSGKLKIHSYDYVWDGDRNPVDLDSKFNFVHGPFDFSIGFNDKVMEEDIFTIYSKLRESKFYTNLGYWVTNHFYTSISPSFVSINDLDQNYKMQYGFKMFYIFPLFPSFSLNYDYFFETFDKELSENGNNFIYFAPKSYRNHKYSLNYSTNFYNHYYYDSSLGYSRYSYLYKDNDYVYHLYNFKNTIGYNFKGLYKIYLSIDASKSSDNDINTDIYSGMGYQF